MPEAALAALFAVKKPAATAIAVRCSASDSQAVGRTTIGMAGGDSIRSVVCDELRRQRRPRLPRYPGEPMGHGRHCCELERAHSRLFDMQEHRLKLLR
jgi:hypothetical protein